MVNIKIDEHSVSVAISSLEEQVQQYKVGVVNACAQLSNLSLSLKGSGYEALTTQIEDKLNTQKTLVAECDLCMEHLRAYLSEMSDAELAVTFG